MFHCYMFVHSLSITDMACSFCSYWIYSFISKFFSQTCSFFSTYFVWQLLDLKWWKPLQSVGRESILTVNIGKLASVVCLLYDYLVYTHVKWKLFGPFRYWVFLIFGISGIGPFWPWFISYSIYIFVSSRYW